ncbi:unnamed protein product [Brachionus calyciflorus]|uniref:Uncharacterized protein n=1 Tax=Brachionus calyciflorus TaxID=104777 RepID=A0A814AK68_9BILA|nr:unnamed protein product [Brachionus calyciflorus]
MSSTDSQVPEFDDTLNDIDNDIDEIVPIKTRGKGNVYDFYKTLSLQEFKADYNISINEQQLVQCFKCSPDIPSCNQLAYLIQCNEQVTIFLEDGQHGHEIKNERGIPEVVKNEIIKLYDVGNTAPKTILRALEKQGIECPLKSQLSIWFGYNFA